MIEEKQKAEAINNRRSAPRRRGHLLRRLVAGVQVWALRCRYHTGRTVDRVNKRLHRRVRTNPLFFVLGNGLYALGFYTEYTAVRLCRVLKKAAAWLFGAAVLAGTFLWKVVGGALRTMLVELFRPLHVFFRGVRNLCTYVNNVRKEKGVLASVGAALRYFARGSKKYAWVLPRSLAYLVPLCAAVGFAVVVHTMVNYDYTLAVQVNGETVGYVESEQVFDSAREAVDERINYAGTLETKWEITPSYTLAIASDVLNENQMADAILTASGDEIAEGTALYLDGKLVAVTTEGKKLEEYLYQMKAPYEDPGDPSLEVRFNRDVELVDGIFFSDSFSDYSLIQQRLGGLSQEQVEYTVQSGDSWSLIASKNGLTMGELFACNPGLTVNSPLFPGDTVIVEQEQKTLEVHLVRTITRQEEIPFATETTQSNEYSFGTTKTIQAGVPGVKDVTEQITYDISGNMLNTVLLNETVVLQPVTKKVIKGTRLPDGQTGEYGSGTFQWPVPNYRYVSRWYGKNGHKGVDICAPEYTPIIAADSGVVTVSGWNAAGRNYGYSLIINHGNGYQTLYAHCVELYVVAGQSVSKGQILAGMGTTGRSTGVHLHFEIRHNGTKLPPQHFFPQLAGKLSYGP